MSQNTMTFWVRVRQRRGKAWKCQFHGYHGDVYVPISLSIRESGRTPDAPDGYDERITVPEWWARKNLVELIAKIEAGPVGRAPGTFTIRHTACQLRSPLQPAFGEPVSGRGSFVELRGQSVYLEVHPSHDFSFTMREADLTHTETATLLGLNPGDVLKLESGAMEFIEPAMWTRAMEAMDAEGQRRRPKRATGENDDGQQKHRSR